MTEKYILVGEYRDGEQSVTKGAKKDVELMLQVLKDSFVEYTMAKVTKEEVLID